VPYSSLGPQGPHASNRLFEWIVSSMMVLMGFTIALPGSVVSDPLNLLISQGWVGEDGLAFFFGIIGVSRLCALWASSHFMSYGPRVRAIGSALGSAIWLEMTFASVWSGMLANKTTLAAAIYGSLTIGELVSCYRATYDAGRGF
jgi:hypothetical protein